MTKTRSRMRRNGPGFSRFTMALVIAAYRIGFCTRCYAGASYRNSMVAHGEPCNAGLWTSSKKTNTLGRKIWAALTKGGRIHRGSYREIEVVVCPTGRRAGTRRVG